MKRSEWKHEIQDDCQFLVLAGHSSMCNEGKTREYCDFLHCPRIELEKKDDDSKSFKIKKR